MTHTITLIPGDGIGPEVSQAVKEILAASGVAINWEEIPARADIERRGMTFLQSGVVESIRKNRVALKGPMMTAVASGPPSINVGLCKALDLYANVRPVKIITERASTRIARFAFEYAHKHGRKKIHAIHKANIMKMSDGLFLASIRAVAKEFPEIDYQELIIDNAC